MRRVKWSSSGSEPSFGPPDLAGSGRSGMQNVWKGFAAFLLGVTLGVSAIIFGETAISGAPGDEPASVWQGQPQLRR
ncbi:hypothetical protein GCM10007036_21100 [Alsobacter metallidurans]|uniref:Uncharacterized protein n=1 Tax=Alsobacter metallidurans TaxID=340221 RepID=A0A917I667_9HYPH|nr:hypothetical protein GCM10007036_21100 [Alsobacter metallidurans]